MTPEVFAEILRKITGYTEHIYLHVLGEPLLHPDLGLLFDISNTLGFRVNLTTNGTLLGQKGDLLLSKAALRQVNVSLHSVEQSGSPEAFQLYLDGVLAFIRDAGSPPPLFINLRLWNMHKTTSDLNERILERLASFFMLPAPILRNCAPGQTLALTPWVFLSWDRQFVWPHAPAPDLGSHGRCRGLRDHIAILVDGTVVPCCLDAEADIPFGNIRHGSLAEILAHPRAVSMREGFARQRIVEPLCRRCGYKIRFAASRDQTMTAASTP
jgi:radical SAM protein with 4Fe4S-binding SPASM domain